MDSALLANQASIRFPNLGIEIDSMRKSIEIFGIDIAFYGMIIATGMLLAMCLVFHEAKITGQKVDHYYDLALFLIVFGVIGARIYYVAFKWEDYKDNLADIFKIRNGGLGIYGGVLAGILVILIFSKIKKLNPFQMMDAVILGVLVGQILGRWGNFFNREAFGGYTDNLLAMQIRLDEVGGIISDSVRNHIVIVDGAEYIQVHPTFLYESLWNLVLLLAIIVCKRFKKFHGQMFAWYAIGYGVGRFFVEGLRTDQLIAPIVNVAISRIVAVGMILAGIVILLLGHMGKGPFVKTGNPERKTE